ncbi:glycoside hydrolase superfamily [Polychytrium aggregatum]|uniref:glycoside hydrolase superfamily n=1 Tax=Polychytrium aggregatum TaxID=110093 RepID=UPI0022FE5BCC|nr:glycoside hydrolase superfamily [Polychytrium aggregatum]KAI9197382.1 glycoside hydrolase superfamily [Polychytrium aggregatum]
MLVKALLSLGLLAGALATPTPPPVQHRPITDYLWPMPRQVVDANATVACNDFWIDIKSNNPDVFNIVSNAFDRFQNSVSVKTHGKWGGSTLPVTIHVADETKASTPAALAGIDESYSLQATKSGIVINATTQAGAVYGLQTLSQLVTPDANLVLGSITDSPRFPYRGILLDTARNYFPVEDIKRILDGLAYSKINVMKWLLYEAQSFTIVWDKYPVLYQEGAYKDAQGKPKVFTKQDIQDVINYAFERNIRIIPVFETPSHNGMFGLVDPSFVSGWKHAPFDGDSYDWANSSYPAGTIVWFGRQYCFGPPCGGLDPRVPGALNLLTEFLTEVGSWFPDPVIHVGHSEANPRLYGVVPDSWDIADQSTLDPFMRAFEPQLVNILKSINKKYGAWDVITTLGMMDLVPKDGIITLGELGGDPVGIIETLAAAGFENVVVSPDPFYFLDCSPSQSWCLYDYEAVSPADTYNLPGYIVSPGQWHNWTKIYTYDPLDGLSPAAAKTVKGGFGTMWAETLKRHNIDRFIFPRIASIAERMWTYDAVALNNKTGVRLDRFRASLVNELKIAAADINYLGNQEGMIYRPEYCDTHLNTPDQTVSAFVFIGAPLTDRDGNPPVDPLQSHYAAHADWCKIASLYTTNSFVYTAPNPVPYPY